MIDLQFLRDQEILHTPRLRLEQLGLKHFAGLFASINALENGATALKKHLGGNPAEWTWRKVHIAEFNALIGSNPTIGYFMNRSFPSNLGAKRRPIFKGL